MRLITASLVFALVAGCSDGTPLKDLPNKNVSKKAREWKDLGAQPDQPLDAGVEPDAGDETPDAGEAELDAGLTDAGM